jgi:hypothetical protein
LSLATDTKGQVWTQLQAREALPDLSQFVVLSGNLEVTKLERWPAGPIVAVPHTFPVTWKIEDPAQGFVTVTQEKMTPMITIQEAWQLLHTQVPRLFQQATFNYRGKPSPGQTIQADIARKDVEVAVRFQICHKGAITFTHEIIPNTTAWAEIHAPFAEIDQRIPRYSFYIEDENRPECVY